MGVFNVEVRLRNSLGFLLPESQKGRQVACEALVDTGSSDLCLPAEMVEQLGLIVLGRKNIQTADGGRYTWRLMGMVELEVQGRDCKVRAIELPSGATPLLGADPLAVMDWHISPKDARLIPRPPAS